MSGLTPRAGRVKALLLQLKRRYTSSAIEDILHRRQKIYFGSKASISSLEKGTAWGVTEAWTSLRGSRFGGLRPRSTKRAAPFAPNARTAQPGRGCGECDSRSPGCAVQGLDVQARGNALPARQYLTIQIFYLTRCKGTASTAAAQYLYWGIFGTRPGLGRPKACSPGGAGLRCCGGPSG